VLYIVAALVCPQEEGSSASSLLPGEMFLKEQIYPLLPDIFLYFGEKSVIIPSHSGLKQQLWFISTTTLNEAWSTLVKALPSSKTLLQLNPSFFLPLAGSNEVMRMLISRSLFQE